MSYKLLVLAGAFIAIVPTFVPAYAENPLSQIKVGILYENVTDGVGMGRSLEETNVLLKDTQAGFLFRGFWKWEPVVESPQQIPIQLLNMAREEGIDHLAERIEKDGKSYRSLERWVERIKSDNPTLIFCGAVPAQHLAKVEIDAKSGRVYTAEETWAMALDPQKWKTVLRGNIATKQQLQAQISGDKTTDYDRYKAKAYFPDLTNPDFQSLLESWAERQIDLGADAIWIDMLLAQTKMFLTTPEDVNHPAVRDSYMAAVKIVDDLHRYGADRGKNILIGSWGQHEGLFAAMTPPLNLDFVTVTPSREEIENRQIDTAEWSEKLADIRRIHGNVPIFAFIDWSLETSPLASFSQSLSAEEQRKMLQEFDQFFAQENVKFIYPVHGGYMGKDPKKHSFGKFSTYDSLAPEFDTFKTIKALAAAKVLFPRAEPLK